MLLRVCRKFQKCRSSETKMNYCLIFDLDGTLIDSVDDLAAAVNYMRNEYGLSELSRDVIQSYIGNGVKELIRRSIQDSICDFDGALEKMSSYYREHLVDKTCCYQGVRSGLAELAANGFVMGVWTNKNEQPARRILSKLDISKYFDFIIGGDTGYAMKPEPDGALAIMKEFNCSEDTTFILGDHYTDLEAGRRANIGRVFASYGLGDPHEEKPDFVVDCFADFVTKMITIKHKL